MEVASSPLPSHSFLITTSFTLISPSSEHSVGLTLGKEMHFFYMFRQICMEFTYTFKLRLCSAHRVDRITDIRHVDTIFACPLAKLHLIPPLTAVTNSYSLSSYALYNTCNTQAMGKYSIKGVTNFNMQRSKQKWLCGRGGQFCGDTLLNSMDKQPG